MFAHKGETLAEYWDYIDRIFEFPEGANMILDDGGDATLYILLGARFDGGEVDILASPESEEGEVLNHRFRGVYPPPSNRPLPHCKCPCLDGAFFA